MNDNDIEQVFRQHGFHLSRMIGYSKSMYVRTFPNNTVYFNANIFVEGHGKIWYGDIDFTLDENTLKLIAAELNTDLYILREMDGRFENENLEFEKVKEKAQQIVKHS